MSEIIQKGGRLYPNMTKNIICTGGCGFIGSWIVDTLIEDGYKVIVVDNLSSGSLKNLNKKAEFYKMDIRDNRIKEVFRKHKPEYVIHTAAEINVRESIINPIESADVNILGTLNLLNNCVKFKVKKFIFSSTGGAIYGEDSIIPTPESEAEIPESPYGILKLSIEKYLNFYKNVHGLDYVALRYSNVFGPRQNYKGEAGVVAIFINNLLSGEEVIINGDGEQTRDYCFVKDVAQANILALNLSASDSSGVFNVGTGEEISVNKLFKDIQLLLNREQSPRHINTIKGELVRSCLDATKIKREGWNNNYSFSEGLKETVDFFKEEKNK